MNVWAYEFFKKYIFYEHFWNKGLIHKLFSNHTFLKSWMFFHACKISPQISDSASIVGDLDIGEKAKHFLTGVAASALEIKTFFVG